MLLIKALCFYAVVHAYVYWKIAAAAPKSRRLWIVLAVALSGMAVAPVVGRVLESWGLLGGLAGPLQLLGFSWLAVVFWFCSSALILDTWNLGVRLLSLAVPSAKAVRLSPRVKLAMIATIVAICVTWGLIEANSIRLRKMDLTIAALPAGSEPIRVVQISDLHLGTHTGWKRLARAVRLVESACPDVIVSTGDMVDSPLRHLRPPAEMLAAVNAPLGKFAVLGNHEFYNGVEESLSFHAAAGFRVLREESVQVTDGLIIAGVDYPASRRALGASRDSDAAALPPRRPGQAVILLKHKPAVSEAGLDRFDLQLSGHTHGGQIFPFNFVIGRLYEYISGLYVLERGNRIYVSPGTGTWGPPMRVGARPEVTLFILRPAKAEAATTAPAQPQ